MKYIKEYRSDLNDLFNVDELVTTCKEILLELNDGGFYTKVRTYDNIYNFNIRITIVRKKRFIYEDIREDIERIGRYLKDFNFIINRFGSDLDHVQKPILRPNFEIEGHGNVWISDIGFIHDWYKDKK